MKTNKSINALWDDCLVGVLAMTPDRSVAFQYSDQWIERGDIDQSVFFAGKQ